ncbi:hypothetical protein Q8A73_011340 [Channa argus]|nr:hypothetical protein Q8A73_011340 [Channa argus]
MSGQSVFVRFVEALLTRLKCLPFCPCMDSTAAEIPPMDKPAAEEEVGATDVLLCCRFYCLYIKLKDAGDRFCYKQLKWDRDLEALHLIRPEKKQPVFLGVLTRDRRPAVRHSRHCPHSLAGSGLFTEPEECLPKPQAHSETG